MVWLRKQGSTIIACLFGALIGKTFLAEQYNIKKAA
jgi:hypothetical protein